MSDKMIPIPSDIHLLLKAYCDQEGLIMKKHIERILKNWLDSTQTKQKYIPKSRHPLDGAELENPYTE